MRIGAIWLFAIASAIWGSTWLAIKYQLTGVAPEVSVAYRFALAAALLAWYVTRYTRFGRELYAIGNHPVSARYVGVPIARRLFSVYAISGMVAGLCGYLWVARYAVAFTEIANGFELNVIAACVIGGISIAGGVGSALGAILGALFLGVIANALPVVQVSPFWQSAITGTVIVVAVVLNAREGRRAGKQILPLHDDGARKAPSHPSTVEAKA